MKKKIYQLKTSWYKTKPNENEIVWKKWKNLVLLVCWMKIKIVLIIFK